MGVKITIDHPDVVVFAREDKYRSEDVNYGNATESALEWLSTEMDLDEYPASDSRDHALMANWLRGGTHTLEQRLRDGDAWCFGPFVVRVEMYEPTVDELLAEPGDPTLTEED